MKLKLIENLCILGTSLSDNQESKQADSGLSPSLLLGFLEETVRYCKRLAALVSALRTSQYTSYWNPTNAETEKVLILHVLQQLLYFSQLCHVV